MKHIQGMKLATYLSENNLTDSAFAELAGLKQPHVNRMRRGLLFPSKDVVLKIKEVTGGQVAPADWYEEETAAKAAEQAGAA